MAMYDKGKWADAVGAATPWSMRGTPELVVTDAGAGYRSVQFRAAAEDQGISVVRAVAGEPRLRGRIERMFRTIGSTLIARLSGRTFSNVIERADHPSADRAALTIDDLTQALIRWTVDIYHNTPHAGLGGMTPIEAWSKGVARWGITPEPDMSMRRLAFGARLRRELQAGGITVLGVRYHSEELHRWSLRTRQRTVPVRWHAADLGAIEAEFDGRWREVAAVFDAFRGRTAEYWTAATRRLRADAVARQAVTEPVVRSAFAEIDAINAAAMRRANILTPDWSPDRIAAMEERLFIGLTLAETEQRSPAAPDGIPGRPVRPHASLSQPTVDVADAPADAGEERAPQGPDDDADAGGDNGSDSDHDWRVEE
jgi:putative transposase